MSTPHGILYAVLAVAFVLVFIGVRGHIPQGPAGPAPVLDPDPYVWLACHSLVCGRLETRHLPAADGTGTAICRECGSIRAETTDA